VGEGVTGLERGDPVYGVTNKSFTGAYAEYAVALAGGISRKPSRLSDIEAAAVPVVAVTAWQALFDYGGAKEGQRILIHGAAGSVGTYAVRFARAAKARVIATAGANDLEFVRRLGADEVIDYRARRFENAVREVDLVIDLVGGETQRRSFAVLRPGGTLVSAVSTPDRKLAERYAVRALYFYVDVSTQRLAGLAKLIDAGELAPDIGAVLTLSRARLAHEMLEGARERPRGKIVLWVND
jgi:NADPH:quinone reductase-like Zn-dependent oxidoreductase